MTEFLTLLVLGMATGGFYTMNALGFVVVYRSSRIINFAGVGTAMVGGYLQWQLADQWGWPTIVSVIVAVGASAAVSLLIYVLAIRPLNRASTLTKVIATLAVLVSLQEALILIFGGLPKLPTAILSTTAVNLDGIKVGENSLIILAVSGLLTLGLWAFYRRSRFGIAVSALAEAPDALATLGWNIERLRAANWAIAGALAGLAGVGLGPILQLTPGVFTDLLVPTLAGALIAGLASFPLTLLGCLAVGAAQAEAARYISFNGAGDAVPFLLIIIVLGVRGQGLPLRSYVQERMARAGSGQIRPVRLALICAGVAVAGVLVSDSWVIGATLSALTAIVLLSQVVITGYAGQLSLAQLPLAGVGGLVAANLAASAHLPFIVSLVVGMLSVIPISLMVGLPSLRARGVSLAIATLGFGVAINSTVLTSSSLTGGFEGLTLPSPNIFGFSIDPTFHPHRYFFVVAVVFTLIAFAVTNVRRGRTGRRLIAVRTNERAAEALGIGVTGVKLYAFVLAGVIAAAAGILMAFSQSVPQFTGFDPLTGLTTLLGGVLGGIGYIGGTAIGGMTNTSGLPSAILYPWVGNAVWWTELLPLLTGVLVVAQLIANPDGIADVIAHGRATRRRRRRGRFAVPRALLRRVSPDHRRAATASRLRSHYREELAAVDMSRRRPEGKRLVARDVRVAFGGVVAVDGVDLSVDPGEVLAIIGPNGAGKTTLMDAITGFVGMSGVVELAGRRIDRQSPSRRARAGIARSFQSLELFEDMTVMDNLRCAADEKDVTSLVLDLAHPARGGVTPATVAAIRAFGLEDKLDRLPTELGYGDRRLVAIARAVAGEPSVLLLDEPAAGLSEVERVEVARIIKIVAKEWKLAVLLIEHDVELIQRVADRAVVLDFGRPICSGTPAKVLADPAVVQAYLGEEPTHEDGSDPPDGEAGGARATPLDGDQADRRRRTGVP
jgi:ABC-type branched-subunit amino acid transport system ATPase component/branched-subunit amino acid ABC-type transport system permease component